MKSKGILLVLLIAILAFAVIPIGQVGAQAPHKRGPKEDFLHIINYGATDPEFEALELNKIDITDWPLTAFWINKWVAAGKIPSEITLDPYAEIGSWEYDIYCQKWPTGCDGVAEREGYSGTYTNLGKTWNMAHTRQRPSTSIGMEPLPYDPAATAEDALNGIAAPFGNGSDYDPDTSSWKVYFDDDCFWCTASWGLRLAIAYTTDKDYVIGTILEGLGKEMRAWATAPAQEGFLDIGNLTNSWFDYIGPEGKVRIPSLIFSQNLTKAAALLDAAGFKDWDVNGKRNDPRKVAGPNKKYEGGTNDDIITSASDMDELIFYIRLEDPNREAAGLHLAADLETLGVPINEIDVDRALCFRAVMIEYNYHLYTGGYSFGADPWEIQQSLWHSNQYWYPVGWAGGYQGFCHVLNDQYLDWVKNGATFTGDGGVFPGVHNATFLQNKYACSIPLWSSATAYGYRTGWEGVVNHVGYGTTWGTGGVYFWSLFNMEKAGTNKIRMGLHSAPDSLSVVSSEWVFEWEVLDVIYETLIVRNPYNLAEEEPMLATSWSTGTWDGDKVYVDFTLKNNVTWHDGTKLTAEDVAWGLEFIRDCGTGVAWNYMMMADVENVTVTTPGEGGSVRVYFTTGSAWALHLAGFLEFPNKRMWMNASAHFGWGYDPTKPPGVGPGKRWPSDAQRMMVRDYHPYRDDVYDPTSATPKADGTFDLAQDGTGPWVFVGVTGVWESIDLVAFRSHHLFQDDVEAYLAAAFNDRGNVNYLGSTYTYPSTDRRVDEFDMTKVEMAMFTDAAIDPPGSGWGQYNVDADFDDDNKVNIADYTNAGANYGTRGG